MARGPNVRLLQATLAQIEAHPETWNQSIPARGDCGTTYCAAGWAVTLDGCRWADPTTLAMLRARRDDPPEHISPNGLVACEDRAQRILRLSDREARRLFRAGADLDMLRSEVAYLCAGEGQG